VPRVRVSSSNLSDSGITTTASITHTCPARRLLGVASPIAVPAFGRIVGPVRVVNGSCVFMEVRRLPPGLYQYREPTAGRHCAYSSSPPERQLERKRRAPRPKSPSPPSPVRDHAITPTLLCAKALSGSAGRQLDLHATDGSRQKTCPAAGAERIARCRLFPEPSRGSPQWPVRLGGIFINGPDA